ncbi:hypothetical protein SAMN04515647_1185 [Cohaesibacter sp. ES.047]|uniref:hypothetical protein n=1 Tax=Cohaesibacter sp. ES.047 TaxID=1798205 RepID=UPI000BB87545|nr:hypothetical protein [Cohaesibacter sp. ES.047]SNY90993.1 hypothetical protein SAMN04515647_1185 [Cohaesibacter sp. ES.047]
MADYYVILKRAVGVLPEGTREQRQAIYDKARKALLAQLQSMDPPLAPSEISKQRMALEEAVRSVERDLTLEREQAEADAAAVASDANASEHLHDDTDSFSPHHRGAPEVSAHGPDHEDALQHDAGERDVGEGTTNRDDYSPSRPANDRGEREEDVEPVSPSDKVIRRAGHDVLKNAVRDANAIGSATDAAVRSAKDAADAVGEAPEPYLSREARTEAPKYDERIEPSLAGAPRPAAKPDEAKTDAGFVVKDGPIGGLPEEDEEPKKGLGFVVGGVLLAGVIGAGGYLLYDNRDAFVSTLNDVSSGDGPSEVASDGPTTTGEETIPSKTVRTVTVTAPDEGAPDAAAQAGPDQTSGDAVETAQTDTDEATNLEPADAVAAERSILYEEEGPNGEPGTAEAGEAVWDLEGEGDEAVVVLTASFPEQDVTFDIRISKNSDEDLPASHLIEISIFRDEDAPDKAIQSIPGLILKPTEQTRGEGLIGAAIRISDDMHWIALTAGEREIRYNLELLLLRSWIDIPLQYASQRRAILTLEKGDSGDDVIKAAIKEWSGE